MEAEANIRFGVFLGAFLVITILELFLSRRARLFPRARRWTVNLGMALLDTLCLRGVAALSGAGLAVGAAVWAEGNGFGLMQYLAPRLWVAWTFSLLFLDLALYAQHVVTHKVPFLWRIHQVHHSDADLDVSTALRFHPVEMVLSMSFKVALVLVLGPPPGAVVAFEVILNAAAMFNHADLRLAPGLDRFLRRLVVTPDMHRVHHSVLRAEMDSNYGFNVPWWDWLFGTYRAGPAAGLEGMKIGLLEHPDANGKGLLWALGLPFQRSRRPGAPDRPPR